MLLAHDPSIDHHDLSWQRFRKLVVPCIVRPSLVSARGSGPVGLGLFNNSGADIPANSLVCVMSRGALVTLEGLHSGRCIEIKEAGPNSRHGARFHKFPTFPMGSRRPGMGGMANMAFAGGHASCNCRTLVFKIGGVWTSVLYSTHRVLADGEFLNNYGSHFVFD